ncbi:hypothetical protein VP01_8704g1, partial [Puccinia sorghi]
TTPRTNREESMDVENSPLDTVLNVFQGQWLMWMNARDVQNARMMRMALTQAISSQDLIIEMGGQREVIRICDNWDAREELRRLDYLPHSLTTLPRRLAITDNTYQPTVTNPSSLVAQNLQQTYHQIGPMNTPLEITNSPHENTPAPMEDLTVSQDLNFLGFNNQMAGMEPPLPAPQPNSSSYLGNHPRCRQIRLLDASSRPYLIRPQDPSTLIHTNTYPHT